MALTKIRETEFATYYFDSSNALLKEHWTNQSGSMQASGFKKTIVNYMELVNQHNIKKALIDTRQFNYLIDVAIQEWQDREVFQKINSPVEKIAFLLPEDAFEEFAIKQVMEESAAVKNHNAVKYFNTEEKAMAWLLE